MDIIGIIVGALIIAVVFALSFCFPGKPRRKSDGYIHGDYFSD